MVKHQMSLQIKMMCVISPIIHPYSITVLQNLMYKSNCIGQMCTRGGPMLIKISFVIEGLISIWN